MLCVVTYTRVNDGPRNSAREGGEQSKKSQIWFVPRMQVKKLRRMTATMYLTFTCVCSDRAVLLKSKAGKTLTTCPMACSTATRADDMVELMTASYAVRTAPVKGDRTKSSSSYAGSP